MSFFWKGKPVNTLQLTNKDRLEIVRAGLGSELIVAMVKDRAAQVAETSLLPLSRRPYEKS